MKITFYIHSILTLSLILCFINPLSAQKTFQKRAEKILHFYDTLKSPHLVNSILAYRRGDFEKGDSTALLTPHLNKPSGDMFWLFGVTAFSACRKLYIENSLEGNKEVLKKIKYHLKHYPVTKGNTENHALIYYTCLYILPDIYPELISSNDWFHGKSPVDMKKEAYNHLQSWIQLVTTEGMAEFDSPTYYPEYMFCMALLSQFASDKNLRFQAELMINWLLIDFALDHLDGMMLGGHSREDPKAVYTPRKGNATEFAYLYFGVGEHQNSLSWCVWVNALCGNEASKYIQEMALNRSKPILNLEKHRTRDRYRHVLAKRIPVYKTTYMTSEYGLSSIQGGILQPIQQHTWSVRFKGTKPYSTIFGLHPYWSKEELEMYFEDLKTVEGVSKEKPTYNQETKWTGSSPYESIFQYKNDLLALYKIPSGTQTEHIDIFFPKTLTQRKTLESGWIVSQADKTYIGVYIYQPYEWLQLPEDEMNHRVRSKNLVNGYVVVVRDKKEVGSFEKFCNKINKTKPIFRFENDTLEVVYKNLNKDVLKFSNNPDTSNNLNGHREVNGLPYEFKDWKLFKSPFTDGDDGVLKIKWKGKKYWFCPKVGR